MFKGLGNFAALIKQAQQLGGKMQELNEQLKERKVTGTAGAGMVEVEVNGLGEVLRTKLDPQLVSGGDRELMEDLITAAVNQAVQQSRELHAEAMQGMTGDLELPGLNEALAKFTGGGDGQSS